MESIPNMTSTYLSNDKKSPVASNHYDYEIDSNLLYYYTTVLRLSHFMIRNSAVVGQLPGSSGLNNATLAFTSR